jgi:hypothetical protein
LEVFEFVSHKLLVHFGSGGKEESIDDFSESWVGQVDFEVRFFVINDVSFFALVQFV